MNNTYETQLTTMLILQNDINSKIDADWKDKHRPWNRAAWIECAELMDHIGYKWWKASSPNMEQVRMELVDVWHFGLSYYAECNLPASDLTPVFEKELKQLLPPSSEVMLYHCEALAEAALVRPGFPLREFINMMNHCSMDMDMLFTMYVGKNVLNALRQDYGYKDGTYIKEWFGAEDNEVLSVIMNGLDARAPDFPECVRHDLEKEYQKVLEKEHQKLRDVCDK